MLESVAVERRVKLLHCPHAFLVDLLRLDGSRRIAIDGLPVDARIVSVSDQSRCDCISFLVQSAEFNEVHTGDYIPVLKLNIRRVDEPPVRTANAESRVGKSVSPLADGGSKREGMMTREEILAMPPGREIDAAIASLVFGHEVGKFGDLLAIAGNPQKSDGRGELLGAGVSPSGKSTTAYAVPCYSTDIAAAWQVAEHLRRDGLTVRMSLHPDDTLGRPCHYVEFVRLLGKQVQRTLLVGSECMPLSICRAALLTTLS